jgi:MarR family transcriptional regulator, organic hydroperoxide resistance regulator
VTRPPTALTTTNPALATGGNDDAFRKLLYDLFTLGERMSEARRYFGRQVGLTGPQFTLLTAVRELQGDGGASAKDVAAYLHVSAPFVAAQSAHLAGKGLLEKRPDADDARVTRLRLTPAGTGSLAEVLPAMRRINDLIFTVQGAEEFRVLCRAVDRFVDGSAAAMGLIAADRHTARLRSGGGGS